MLLEGISVATDELKVNLKADYKRVNYKDPKFEEFANLSNSLKWGQVSPRVQGDRLFSDLCAPFELARCPYCEHLIPTMDFRDKKCSLCGAVLKTPPAAPIDETKKFPFDPKDADEDADGDGFTNIEEFRAGTDFKDPKSHPSYTVKLSVIDIVRKKLNIRVKNIIAKGDKSAWSVQTSVVVDGKDRERFPKVGDLVKGDDGEFKLLDIITDFKTEVDPNLKASVERNYSKAIFQKTGSDEKLVGEIGKDIVESKEKIILLYGITNKKIELYVGDAITLGDERTGIEKLVVVSCDPSKLSVSLKREDGMMFELLHKQIEHTTTDKERLQRPPVPF